MIDALARKFVAPTLVTPEARPPLAVRRGARLELWLYGGIDEPDGFQSGEVCAELDTHYDALSVVLRIASRGGADAGGRRIADALIRHRGRSVALVDREAYSAMATVTAGADLVWMRLGARWMTHRSRITLTGNARELHRWAEDLNTADQSASNFIAHRRGIDPEVVRRLRDAERFLTAEEAIGLGLADRLLPALTVHVRALPALAREFHPRALGENHEQQ